MEVTLRIPAYVSIRNSVICLLVLLFLCCGIYSHQWYKDETEPTEIINLKAFSFKVPRGWVVTAGHSVDLYLGEFEGLGIRGSYVFGGLRTHFSPKQNGLSEVKVDEWPLIRVTFASEFLDQAEIIAIHPCLGNENGLYYFKLVADINFSFHARAIEKIAQTIQFECDNLFRGA